jgi:lysophospholipase L1-like esterase
VRVLVFGASITQGFWDTEGGWAVRLYKHYAKLKLREITAEDDYPDVFNLGISGDTSKDLLRRFESETSARLTNQRQGAIIFSIGTNNAITNKQGELVSPLSTYKEDLEQLIEKARQLTTKIMFVELVPCEEDRTTPVFWRDIYYRNKDIAAVNGVIRQVANDNQIKFVEVFEPMRQKMSDGAEFFADGLHPNDAGHQFIFERVQPELDKLLNT